MADRDETQPVLEEGDVIPSDFHNNPNTPIILQWRDRWERENRPDFVGPPDGRNPKWHLSDYEWNRQIRAAEQWQRMMNERRSGTYQA